MRYSRRQQAGLTLIEVIASLALLGTLMTGIVLAKSQLIQQSASAQNRIDAVENVDRLLNEWVILEKAVPCPDTGELEGWRWTTRWLANDELQDVASRRVRVELWRNEPQESNISGEARRPACVVDVVVAKPIDTAEGTP